MPPPLIIAPHPDDDVVIARATLMQGVEVIQGTITAERIPAGHKVSVRPIAPGASPFAATARSVDGVVALTHKTGCGMTQKEPLALLRRTLGGFARHVNFSHVIMLGLGCEVNQIGGLMEEQRLPGRLRGMDIQDMGGTRKTAASGFSASFSVLPPAKRPKARASISGRRNSRHG